MIVTKPWGNEKVWAANCHYAGKILHIKAGHRTSKQLHQEKHESLLVLSGQLGIELVDKSCTLEEGETFYLPAGTIHRLSAKGHLDCDVVEVSSPELDDVVRLEDDYGR